MWASLNVHCLESAVKLWVTQVITSTFGIIKLTVVLATSWTVDFYVDNNHTLAPFQSGH